MKKINQQKIESPFLGKSFRINQRKVTVNSVIAQGGFAVVFLVSSDSDGQRFALKRVCVNNDEDFQQLMLEIQITKRLNGHKNIVRMVDWSLREQPQEIREVLILLTLYPDCVLNKMNEKIESRLTEQEVMNYFCGCCEAIQALHHSNPPIIHRDIKVENLLLDSQNNVVLCDFGSAMVTKMDPLKDGVTRVQDNIQKYTTLTYRSPEMIDLYSSKVIDTKSDIWALGCLLYRLCFYSNCFGESILAISSAQFTIPDKHSYSTNLLKLMRYLLEADSDKRPDIDQVIQLANILCHKYNNFKLSLPISFDKLLTPLTETEAKNQRTATPNKNRKATPETVKTSINIRERPKVSTNRVQAFNFNNMFSTNKNETPVLTNQMAGETVYNTTSNFSDKNSDSNSNNKIQSVKKCNDSNTISNDNNNINNNNNNNNNNKKAYNPFKTEDNKDDLELEKMGVYGDKKGREEDEAGKLAENFFKCFVEEDEDKQNQQIQQIDKPLIDLSPKQKQTQQSLPFTFQTTLTTTTSDSKAAISLLNNNLNYLYNNKKLTYFPLTNQQSLSTMTPPLQFSTYNFHPIMNNFSRISTNQNSPFPNSHSVDSNNVLQNPNLNQVFTQRHRRNMSDTTSLSSQTKQQQLFLLQQQLFQEQQKLQQLQNQQNNNNVNSFNNNNNNNNICLSHSYTHITPIQHQPLFEQPFQQLSQQKNSTNQQQQQQKQQQLLQQFKPLQTQIHKPEIDVFAAAPFRKLA